ncbi:lipopolysaccharide biosynthesis protein [Helicobacter mehlei]|uniref:lipopolysaccharide biosynthesis protein n=1 Tax=Helicobacter mehlei TaxID=2316080 RepID=UPI001F1C9EE3|nr:lipopolysaccharide biosynthesis protein [Helicobacter mehlei]
MRIFVIHLSKQTCLKYGLRERNAEPLLESLQNPKHPVEVFDAIYAKISKGLHPLVQQHAHPYFVHTSVRQDLVGRVCGGGGGGGGGFFVGVGGGGGGFGGGVGCWK